MVAPGTSAVFTTARFSVRHKTWHFASHVLWVPLRVLLTVLQVQYIQSGWEGGRRVWMKGGVGNIGKEAPVR